MTKEEFIKYCLDIDIEVNEQKNRNSKLVKNIFLFTTSKFYILFINSLYHKR